MAHGFIDVWAHYTVGGGLGYDLRFRTPNQRVNWAVGASVTYAKQIDAYTPRLYVHDWSYLALRPSLLIGKKAVVFEVGLRIQYGIWQQRDIPNTGSYQQCILALPIGVRYQRPQGGVFVAANLAYQRRWIFPIDSFWDSAALISINVQLSVGYSFATKPLIK